MGPDKDSGMTERSAKWLAFVLRFECVILLSALVAVFLPHSVMDSLHAQMGLGELPDAPIVDYLTRSLSLIYASNAPLCGFVARDVRRYREIILVQAWVGASYGLGLLGLDLVIGMPPFWTICEGPLVIALSIAVLLLARLPRAGAAGNSA